LALDGGLAGLYLPADEEYCRMQATPQEEFYTYIDQTKR